MPLSDWTYNKTVSAARTIRIVYTIKENDIYERRVARLTSTQWSETMTTYSPVDYVSRRWVENGQVYEEMDRQWVVSVKETWTRDTIASINGNLVKWCLENNLGLPDGDCVKYSITENTYEVIDTQGPRLSEEKTREEIDYLELLGSLNINDYGPIGGASLSGGSRVISQITVVKHAWSGEESSTAVWNGVRSWREYTKTSTSRWLAYGLTQEGQQAASEMLKQEDGTGAPTQEVVASALELKYDGTEIQTSTGRLQVAARPNDEEIAKDDIQNDTGDIDPQALGSGSVYSSDGADGSSQEPASADFDFGTDAIDWQDYAGINPETNEPDWAPFVDGDWQDYDQDSNGDGVPDWAAELPTAGGLPNGPGTSSVQQYDMPFAPDDYYGPNGTLIKGKAAQAARRYAETMNALKAANAFGLNVTTAVQKVGTQPLAPLYLNAGGLRVQTRMNGTAWAFGNMGIVVSSDLMLAGVVAKTA